MEGYFAATNSDLFMKVHKVLNVNRSTGKIKMKVTCFYKSSGNICDYITPLGNTDLTLDYNVVKHWKRYKK